ncbi:MAG: Integrase catalytic region [bacterium]|nr:Integrase catalytic region [bacterium]
MSRRIDGKLTLDAAKEYQQRLQQHRMICSMSRKGDCWDNAVVESFFATLKVELLGDDVFADQARAQRLVFEYIETYYNRRRRHSTLGYVSPAAYERAA